jgi:hypothetical protein
MWSSISKIVFGGAIERQHSPSNRQDALRFLGEDQDVSSVVQPVGDALVYFL